MDYPTLKNRRILAYNGHAFDYVFCHDQSSLNVCRALGCKRVSWLSTSVIYSRIHRKLATPKKYDVVFVGTQTPRRKRILDKLSDYFDVYAPRIWDPVLLNTFYNQAKIVLNIHASDVLNTETRLCEVMGSGSFLLSEEISTTDMFENGKHLVYWKHGQIDDLLQKVDYYLDHEKERERIAKSGHEHALKYHTLEKRIEMMLSIVNLKSSKPDRLERPKQRLVQRHWTEAEITRLDKIPKVLIVRFLANLWALTELLKVRLQAAGFKRPKWIKPPKWLR
jgi:hypothetical protein